MSGWTETINILWTSASRNNYDNGIKLKDINNFNNNTSSYNRTQFLFGAGCCEVVVGCEVVLGSEVVGCEVLGSVHTVSPVSSRK